MFSCNLINIFSFVLLSIIIQSKKYYVYTISVKVNTEQNYNNLLRNLKSPNVNSLEQETLLSEQYEKMKNIMDLNVNPCEDFYQYACGNFENLYPIEDDEVTSTPIQIADEKLSHILRGLLENQNEFDAKSHESQNQNSSAFIKAKQFYASCMDTESIQKRGIQPLLELFTTLGGWSAIDPNIESSTLDFIQLLGDTNFLKMGILLSVIVYEDMRNGEEYLVSIFQGSIGMLEKSDYKESKKLEAYCEYIATTLKLLGSPEETAIQVAQDFVDFSQEISNMEEELSLFTYIKDYQKFTITELEEEFPTFDWRRFLTISIGLPINESTIIVSYSTRYIRDLVKFLSNKDPQDIINFIFWRLTEFFVPKLDSQFDESQVKFLKVLQGLKKKQQRWKICLEAVKYVIDDPLSAMFIRKHFDELSKADVLEITKSVRESFRDILLEKEWIDDVSKAEAVRKIDTMDLQLGYSNDLLIDEKINNKYKYAQIGMNYFENFISLLQNDMKINKDLLGKSVDRNEWIISPSKINAGFDNTKNRIIVTAAILQPPFYHRLFPTAIRFGSVGSFIGHEIIHSYGDSGRIFDHLGRYRHWWSNSSEEALIERSTCFIEQFGNYTFLGENINGTMTLEENIADSGGLRKSFLAYKRWVQNNEHNSNVDRSPSIPVLNITDSQLFFLSYAQFWCGATRSEFAKILLKVDTHTIRNIRIKGTLSNSPEFAESYKCEIGSAMNPVKKCSIW